MSVRVRRALVLGGSDPGISTRETARLARRCGLRYICSSFSLYFFFFFGAVMMMLKIRRSLLESTWRCGFTGFCETQRPLGAECRMKKKGIGCCWVKVGSYACLLFHPWRAELEDKEDLLS